MAKHIFIRRIYCCILSLTLIFSVYGSSLSSEEKDSAIILETLKKFYAAYQTKDSSQWKTFWHDNSPVASQREKTFLNWNLTSAPEKITSLAVEKGWDRTFATVEIDFAQSDVKRQIGLIKDGNSWKIWHESSSEASVLAKQIVEKETLDDDLSKIADYGLTSALSWIGYTFYERKQFGASIKVFSLVQKMARQANDSAAEISALISSGHDYLELGKYPDALQTYKRALQISQSADYEVGTIRALSGIGNAANYLGQYFEARNAQEKRLELVRQSGNTRRLLVTLKNLGNTYFYLGEFDKALKSYEESEKLGFQDVGLMLNMGSALTELGKFTEAEKKLQNGLLLARDANNSVEIGHALNGLGQIALKRGQYKEALSFFQQSLKEGVDLKKDEQAKILLNQSYSLFKLQDFQAAASLTERAIQQASESESPEPVWFGQYVLGKIFKNQNKPKQALQSFEQSVNFIEDWLKKNSNADGLESFFQDKIEPYREIVDLLVDHGEDVKAFEYAELSKAKTLLKATKGINQPLPSAPKFSLAEADELLKDKDTALLEYVVTEEAAFLFLITKSLKRNSLPQLTVKKVPFGRRQLENSIGSLRNKLSAENYDFADQAEELYGRLIRPIEDKLADKKKLVIVPDGVIWGVPFQALKMRSDKFLWERFSVTYARSLTSLLANVRKSRSGSTQKRTFLGVANPSPQPTDIIPFAEEGVREIVPFYGLPQTKIYAGSTATEEQIKAVISDYDIIHFATHGFLDNQSPMSSYLQLTTNDISENGKLEANEIQNLKLKADLAVLAGCETGRGKLFDGEGIIGLAWALEKAGVQALVVSHWKVRDKNTKDLMTEFHRLWRGSFAKSEPLSVAEALRLAGLSIQKRHPHPVYWAGFVVMGNGF
jgi:CHAT domain-containing protein